MNRSRTGWLIAALTALGIFGVSAGMSMNWAFTGQSGDSFLPVGNTRHGVILWSISAALLLGMCVGSVHSSRRLTARRKLERSVAHVQATLRRSD